jgi:hypothetical protein
MEENDVNAQKRQYFRKDKREGDVSAVSCRDSHGNAGSGFIV